MAPGWCRLSSAINRKWRHSQQWEVMVHCILFRYPKQNPINHCPSKTYSVFQKRKRMKSAANYATIMSVQRSPFNRWLLVELKLGNMITCIGGKTGGLGENWGAPQPSLEAHLSSSTCLSSAALIMPSPWTTSPWCDIIHPIHLWSSPSLYSGVDPSVISLYRHVHFLIMGPK